jgi:hydroxymethylpyrimidine pyrophosphatase-like HAD family hydrolase
MNGTVAYLREEELLLEYHFSEEVRQELINLGHNFPGSTFAFFTLSTTHLVNPTPFSLHIAEKHYLSHQISKSFDVPLKINKMMVIENDKDELHRIKMHSDGLRAEIAYSLPYLLEFTPKDVNKPTALKSLLSALSLEGIPIYAAGDGQNDLALFDLAEVSFAPSTAHKSILKGVDYIIQRQDKGLLHPIIEIINHKIRAKS